MRVLLISHTCQSRVEGQPRAAQLARMQGIELRVVVPHRWNHYGEWREAERPLDANLDCRAARVLWPWLGPAQNYLHWYPSLGAILREFRPDVIDLWEEPWSLVSFHACWLRNRLLPHAKIISETEQNIDKHLPPPFEPFRAYTLRHADYVVGRNQEAIEHLRAKGYEGTAEVVPNAADADLFQPLDRAQCRQMLADEAPQLNDPKLFIAGYVGRLVEEKGLLDMIEALPFCSSEVRLVFVGAGEMQESLEKRAQQLGCAAQVTILPARPLPELPPIMNALDVLVLPSRTTPSWKEQFGRVIIEAHACKTPVIGSDSGAIPEVIGEAGLVVPEGDARALAQAIETLRCDPERARQMGETGRRQVEQFYTWERVASRMREVYQRALATGAQPQRQSSPSTQHVPASR